MRRTPRQRTPRDVSYPTAPSGGRSLLSPKKASQGRTARWQHSKAKRRCLLHRVLLLYKSFPTRWFHFQLSPFGQGRELVAVSVRCRLARIVLLREADLLPLALSLICMQKFSSLGVALWPFSASEQASGGWGSETES